ncbi:hypothetical protein [Polycladidibacter hongkongensis]|uniref:hypothetical protein n=1 Tax=Polycladidibacter hongkongensis TaxID=1647556 RepID=UPI0008298DE5|nr:hypothetical protein [Pseudovibrio hongkongensis]
MPANTTISIAAAKASASRRSRKARLYRQSYRQGDTAGSPARWRYQATLWVALERVSLALGTPAAVPQTTSTYTVRAPLSPGIKAGDLLQLGQIMLLVLTQDDGAELPGSRRLLCRAEPPEHYALSSDENVPENTPGSATGAVN